jgi:hypothetical protein
MKAKRMQAHIGQHDIPSTKEKVAPIHEDATYPGVASDKLQELYDAALKWAAKCPICHEDGEQVDPLPPPFRINKYLDGVSKQLINHITQPPEKWVYFISAYADRYHNYECCHHPKSRTSR